MSDVPLREYIEMLIEAKFEAVNERITSAATQRAGEAVSEARRLSLAIGVITIIVMLVIRFWK